MSPIKVITPEFKFKILKTYFNELIKPIQSDKGDQYIHITVICKLLIFNDSFTILYSKKS